VLPPHVLPAYRALAWAAHGAAPLLRLPFAATLPARRAALERWRGRAAAGARGAIWVHAASVGEALAAAPIVQRLRAARPRFPIVLTHTSPAPAAWPAGWGVDHADYLPLDTAPSMNAMLDALAPALLMLTRAELWPELLLAALRRGVPVALVGATVSARSKRLRWPLRATPRPLYAGLAYVGAVTEPDRRRLHRLGAREGVLEVTGDPRHDQVLERMPDLRPLRALDAWAAGRDVLVAGSTDTQDARVVLAALAALRAAHPATRLLLCPHEPGAGQTARLLALTRGAGLTATRWRGAEGGVAAAADAPDAGVACVIVERLGILADLYVLGRIAYVGGGFGHRGVHAMIEPAAYALPIVVGPRAASGDARTLVDAGGAVRLPAHDAAGALGAVWQRWLADDAARTRAGLAARGVLAFGAAGRTAARLVRLI
jgi:3-deoxy-D-manno-octulosonic-acid transferase